ncbi:uncharacterized protein UHOR_16344 [Ustilago hordei]|uniref:Uncharacterized protein n=1 Tax=Ustilago hordei TaxID=120017 RepID=I2G4I4_USTHO|nr:uncharacterized protein UHOR_16344 [Ustilago hordei]
MLWHLTSKLSWGQMNAQEELESYEETMHNNCGLGQGRVPTELSEIGRIKGSMTELVRIGRSKALLQSLLGSVVPHLYNRSHGNWLKDASITDLAAGGQQMRKGSPSDEVGALGDNERSIRRWVSWDRMDVQEERDSYEGILCNHCGLGERRVPTEFSEISRIDSSMTGLVRIGRSTGLTTGVSRISGITFATTCHGPGCAGSRKICQVI